MAVKYEYYNTGDDNDNSVYDNLWEAQTFTPTITHRITSVKLKLYRIGSPGTLTVGIRDTSSDVPIGTDLTTGTTDGDSVTTDGAGEWVEITFTSSYLLIANTMYAIVARATSGYANNEIHWLAVSGSPTYSGGTDCYSSNSGSSWTKVTNWDDMFEEWGEPFGENVGVFAVVETRLHYVDAYGQERWIEGTPV